MSGHGVCEYCKENEASPNADGCGKKMCDACNYKYPRVSCKFCFNDEGKITWMRSPGYMCDKCEDKRPPRPTDPNELKTYLDIWCNASLYCSGICVNYLNGYEAVCEHCSKFSSPKEPEEPEEP